MPESKRKYARKVQKKYEMVEFETNIFVEPFVFPSPKHIPIKVMSAARSSDLGAMGEWLLGAGVDPEAVEAFVSLDAEELEDFMKAWADGDISVPKSSKS